MRPFALCLLFVLASLSAVSADELDFEPVWADAERVERWLGIIDKAGDGGFEQCTVSTINRKCLENSARITLSGNDVTVYLKKKTHLPILFELPWMNLNIRFFPGTVS